METRLTHYLSIFHSRAFPGDQFSRVIKRFGCLAQLQETSMATLSSLGLNQIQIERVQNSESAAHQEQIVNTYLQWAENDKNFILPYEDPRYPPLLRQIDCPPPLLFVIGQPEILKLPSLALVGSRKASILGRQNAFWIARTLAQSGLSICSGMAAGIDSQAHLGALSIDGNTVAVLGTGVDRIYPARNRELAAQIGENGVLVSEFPLGAAPAARHFPRRNRIISGISLGVLIVEAALQSGTLITARTAMEQNREVFAIPGAINNPLSRGCHRLIKEGAKLVETPQDILEELDIQFDRELWLGVTNSEDTHKVGNTVTGVAAITPNRGSRKSDKVNPVSALERRASQTNGRPPTGSSSSLAEKYQPSANEARILAALDSESCHLDLLIQETKIDLQELMGALLHLESRGLVRQEAGRYSRV